MNIDDKKVLEENLDSYKRKGYANRDEYLKGLAEELELPLVVVIASADLLGPTEDFDGLVTTLEDAAQMGYEF